MAMSLDAHRAVAEMDAEASKSGAFRRVYPTANGHVHRHIFAQERPLNTMLCEVLRQRAADVANAAEHDLDAISGAQGAARASEGLPPTAPADAPGSAPTTKLADAASAISGGAISEVQSRELADAASAIAQAPPKAATRLAEALGEGQQQQQQKQQPPPQPQPQPQPQALQQPQAQPDFQSSVPSCPARISVQAHGGSWAEAATHAEGVCATLHASRPSSSGLAPGHPGAHGPEGAISGGAISAAYRDDKPPAGSRATPYTTTGDEIASRNGVPLMISECQ